MENEHVVPVFASVFFIAGVVWECSKPNTNNICQAGEIIGV